MNPDEKLTPEQMLRMLDGRMPTKDLDNLKFILNLENLGPELAAEWLMIQDPDDASSWPF